MSLMQLAAHRCARAREGGEAARRRYADLISLISLKLLSHLKNLSRERYSDSDDATLLNLTADSCAKQGRQGGRTGLTCVGKARLQEQRRVRARARTVQVFPGPAVRIILLL